MATKLDAIRILNEIAEYERCNKLSTYNKGKVHRIQMEFHRSQARNRWILGGNRCIGKDSMIYDPVLGKKRKVSEIENDFHVLAYDEKKNKLVVAKALKPFHHPDIDKLYEIVLSNGEKFTASMNHRIMDADGSYKEISECKIGSILFNGIIIMDITYKEEGYKWDFTVPDYKNYYFEGIIHHNTGKTVAGAVEAVWRARGIHPYRDNKKCNGWVVSVSNEVQRDVAQKEILKWLHPSWIKDVHVRAGRKDDPENAIIDFIVVENVFGSTSIIGFKSCDQGRAKFQGTSQNFIWFDEEPPKEIYDECKMRLVDTRGDIWGTMTPLLGLTWVYYLAYLNERNDKEVKCWNMSWADNPFLSIDEITELESSMSDEEREARQHGRFVALSGLVYKEFREDIHVIDPTDIVIPKSWYDNISIDPGFTNPLAASFYAADYDGTVYMIAEHYRAEMRIAEHARCIKAIADELEWSYNPLGSLNALIDSAAAHGSLQSEKSVVELFLENGIACNSNVVKDVWAGILRVKEYLKLRPTDDTKRFPLGKPKLFILSTCPNAIREFKSYRWAESKPGVNAKEEPKKSNDHIMDNLKYYVMSKPAIREAKINHDGFYTPGEVEDMGLDYNEIESLKMRGRIL